MTITVAILLSAYFSDALIGQSAAPATALLRGATLGDDGEAMAFISVELRWPGGQQTLRSAADGSFSAELPLGAATAGAELQGTAIARYGDNFGTANFDWPPAAGTMIWIQPTEGSRLIQGVVTKDGAPIAARLIAYGDFDNEVATLVSRLGRRPYPYWLQTEIAAVQTAADGRFALDIGVWTTVLYAVSLDGKAMAVTVVPPESEEPLLLALESGVERKAKIVWADDETPADKEPLIPLLGFRHREEEDDWDRELWLPLPCGVVTPNEAGEVSILWPKGGLRAAFATLSREPSFAHWPESLESQSVLGLGPVSTQVIPFQATRDPGQRFEIVAQEERLKRLLRGVSVQRRDSELLLAHLPKIGSGHAVIRSLETDEVLPIRWVGERLQPASAFSTSRSVVVCVLDESLAPVPGLPVRVDGIVGLTDEAGCARVQGLREGLIRFEVCGGAVRPVATGSATLGADREVRATVRVPRPRRHIVQVRHPHIPGIPRKFGHFMNQGLFCTLREDRAEGEIELLVFPRSEGEVIRIDFACAPHHSTLEFGPATPERVMLEWTADLLLRVDWIAEDNFDGPVDFRFLWAPSADGPFELVSAEAENGGTQRNAVAWRLERRAGHYRILDRCSGLWGETIFVPAQGPRRQSIRLDARSLRQIRGRLRPRPGTKAIADPVLLLSNEGWLLGPPLRFGSIKLSPEGSAGFGQGTPGLPLGEDGSFVWWVAPETALQFHLHSRTHRLLTERPMPLLASDLEEEPILLETAPRPSLVIPFSPPYSVEDLEGRPEFPQAQLMLQLAGNKALFAHRREGDAGPLLNPPSMVKVSQDSIELLLPEPGRFEIWIALPNTPPQLLPALAITEGRNEGPRLKRAAGTELIIRRLLNADGTAAELAILSPLDSEPKISREQRWIAMPSRDEKGALFLRARGLPKGRYRIKTLGDPPGEETSRLPVVEIRGEALQTIDLAPR